MESMPIDEFESEFKKRMDERSQNGQSEFGITCSLPQMASLLHYAKIGLAETAGRPTTALQRGNRARVITIIKTMAETIVQGDEVVYTGIMYELPDE